MNTIAKPQDYPGSVMYFHGEPKDRDLSIAYHRGASKLHALLSTRSSGRREQYHLDMGLQHLVRVDDLNKLPPGDTY